jgi:hypothetical protein
MKHYLRSTASILLIVALLLSWGPSSALAAAGDVTLDTPKTTVDGNERFVVSVRADAPTGLYGVQLSLTYDDTLLNVLTVSAGSAWPVSDTFVARAAASGGGTANESIEFAATLNSAGSLSGNVELVTILIEAVNPPSTVTTDITHPSRGELQIQLTSPAGTTSRLAEKHTSYAPDPADYPDWTFSTVHNWGEDSRGLWKLKIADRVPGNTGTLTSATLTLYGTAK